MLKRLSVTILVFVASVGIVLVVISMPQLMPFAWKILHHGANETVFISAVRVKAGTSSAIALGLGVVLVLAALAYWLAGKVVSVQND